MMQLQQLSLNYSRKSKMIVSERDENNPYMISQSISSRYSIYTYCNINYRLVLISKMLINNKYRVFCGYTSHTGAGKVWLFLQHAQNPRAPMHLKLWPLQLCL